MCGAVVGQSSGHCWQLLVAGLFGLAFEGLHRQSRTLGQLLPIASTGQLERSRYPLLGS